MKKTISIVLALTMVFVMSFSVFAADVKAAKPSDRNDAEGWTAYYVELLTAEDANTQAIINSIFADYQNGHISADTLRKVLPEAARAAAGDNAAANTILDVVLGLVEFVETGKLPEGVTFPEDITLPGGITLPDITLPSDFTPSFTLPDFGSIGGLDFINTILGALGGLADLIFGKQPDNDPTEEDPTEPDNDNIWDEEGGENGGEGDGSDYESPDLGDMSFVAVSAVAVAAGAALLLTRKKSKDSDAE